MKRILVLMFALLWVNLGFGQVKGVAMLEPICKGGNISVLEREMISATLEETISEIPGFNAFTRTDVNQIMKEQAFQASGMVSDAQRKKIGEMTGAKYICVSQLTVGENIMLKASIIDMESGQIINTANKFLERKEEKIYLGCQELGKTLMSKLTGSTGGLASSSSSSLSSQDYVIIEGIKWATKNVSDTPGKFVSSPKNKGGYYTWETAKTACPSGWRLPDKDELETLKNSGSAWTSEGREFGSGSNKIFMPAAGYRSYSDGSLYYVGSYGLYWSSSPNGSEDAYFLSFYSGIVFLNFSNRKYGLSVRCVAE